MADVEISISGELQAPNPHDNAKNGFDFRRLSQYASFGQISYPQIQQWIQERKGNVKPWTLFLSTSHFKPPPSVPRLSKRIIKNIEYFQSNYLFVFIGLLAYCLITSPLLLLTFVAFAVICYKLSQQHTKSEIRLLNHKLTLVQLYLIIAMCALPIFYIVGAGSVLFWVLGTSWFIVLLHASFYNIDAALNSDENELDALIMEEV